MDAADPPDVEAIKELLRKLDEARDAGAKLRTSIARQMNAAQRRERLAKDDAAVIAARPDKPV